MRVRIPSRIIRQGNLKMETWKLEWDLSAFPSESKFYTEVHAEIRIIIIGTQTLRTQRSSS